MYLVVYDTSVWIPGDERSRTNPGHGYPERTETYQRVEYLGNDNAVQDWLRRHKNTKYRLFEANELKVTEKIEHLISPK